jgi:glycosyltransferase involved in cell wall biosynthesis
MAERADPGRRPGVLHMIHGHGGGTEHHVRALIDASRTQCRHHVAFAIGDRWRVDLHGSDGVVRTREYARAADEAWAGFVRRMCTECAIDVVHLHNVSGARDGIVTALSALRVPYGYTIHDLNFACPTMLFLGVDGKYCGQVTDASACAACLRAQPPFAGVDIVDWRLRHGALVANAAFLIAPSRWAAAALERYYPERRVTVIPHALPNEWALDTDDAMGALPALAPTQGLALPEDGAATVAVLGAVGPDKGARRLERLAALVRSAGTPLRFVLIGYMDVEHGPWQSGDAVLTVHGRYRPRDLPALLAHYRVRLVAFPSAGPETFSFTLSESWTAGYPVIVPPFGALAERVAEANAGFLWTDAEWREEARMLARIEELVAPGNAPALAAAAARGPQVRLSSPDEMAASTLGLYAKAILGAAAASSGDGAPARSARRGRLGAALRRWAASPTARVMSRLAPSRVRRALKARLK